MKIGEGCIQTAYQQMADILEIAVSSFVARAYVPGKKAPYIRVERVRDKAHALHLHMLKVYEDLPEN